MKTSNLFLKIFGYYPEDLYQLDVHFEGKGDTMIVSYFGSARTLYVDENQVTNQEGEFLFFTEDLEKFQNFVDFNECKECNGNGEYYKEVDTSSYCRKYIGDCCGGCSETILVDCECEDVPFKY
jgi:hypothetical protein